MPKLWGSRWEHGPPILILPFCHLSLATSNVSLIPSSGHFLNMFLNCGLRGDRRLKKRKRAWRGIVGTYSVISGLTWKEINERVFELHAIYVPQIHHPQSCGYTKRLYSILWWDSKEVDSPCMSCSYNSNPSWCVIWWNEAHSCRSYPEASTLCR